MSVTGESRWEAKARIAADLSAGKVTVSWEHGEEGVLLTMSPSAARRLAQELLTAASAILTPPDRSAIARARRR